MNVIALFRFYDPNAFFVSASVTVLLERHIGMGFSPLCICANL